MKTTFAANPKCFRKKYKSELVTYKCHMQYHKLVSTAQLDLLDGLNQPEYKTMTTFSHFN